MSLASLGCQSAKWQGRQTCHVLQAGPLAVSCWQEGREGPGGPGGGSAQPEVWEEAEAA
jgi:hypothetical protein